MIGLDTNVLLRYVLGDDPKQTPLARRMMHSLSPADPGWISLATILEYVWVLKTRNRFRHQELAEALYQLLTRDSIVVEQADTVADALEIFSETRADFGDCLIAASARAAGCAKTVTFDEIAARDTGMELIQ